MERHQTYLDKHIPLFQLADGAIIHQTREETPARIVFGRELKLQCDLEFGLIRAPEEDYVDKLRITSANP